MPTDGSTARMTCRRPRLEAIAAVAACLVVIFAATARIGEREAVRRALELARLTNLPDSVTDVRADGKSNLFTASYYLRFSAPPEDIEAFLAASAGQKNVEPERFNPKHMCLVGPPCGGERNHRRVISDDRHPWFVPEVRLRGRRYVVPQDADACYGEVIVNDETGTVFIQSHRC